MVKCRHETYFVLKRLMKRFSSYNAMVWRPGSCRYMLPLRFEKKRRILDVANISTKLSALTEVCPLFILHQMKITFTHVACLAESNFFHGYEEWARRMYPPLS